MNFLNLFEYVNFHEDFIIRNPFTLRAHVEFPLNFFVRHTSPGGSRGYTIPSPDKTPERHVDGDYLLVPISNTVSTDEDAAKLIIAAGVDRNMLVFDNESSPGDFTIRLVNLMKNTMLRNGGGNTSSSRNSLTDLFISKKYWSNTENIYGVQIHLIEENYWDILKVFYEKTLDGTFHIKNDFVIGVSANSKDTFVHPTCESTGEEGLGILGNQKVLLGLF